MPLFGSEKRSAGEKKPLAVKVELLADECGLLMGCLSWVNSELAMMKAIAQEVDKQERNAKDILGGEKVVENMTRNVEGLVDNLTPLIKSAEQVLMAYTALFFEGNPRLSKQDRDDFFQTVEGRMKSVNAIGGLKLRLDYMFDTLRVVRRAQDSST